MTGDACRFLCEDEGQANNFMNLISRRIDCFNSDMLCDCSGEKLCRYILENKLPVFNQCSFRSKVKSRMHP